MSINNTPVFVSAVVVFKNRGEFNLPNHLLQERNTGPFQQVVIFLILVLDCLGLGKLTREVLF